MARRPEVASGEKNPAAAGIRRFFPLSKKSKENISALVVVVVVVVVVVACHLPDAVVVVIAKEKKKITNSHTSPSPAPSWGSSPRSSPSPSCPRPTESHQRLWGERDVRPTILKKPRSATATIPAYPRREGRRSPKAREAALRAQPFFFFCNK